MIVKQSSTFITFTIALSLCLLSTYASAKDIQNEQRNAYEARKTYNNNQSKHQNLLNRIKQQEKRVAGEQERLDKLIAEEATAKAELDQSKADLDTKVRILNDAWNLRDQ